MRQSGTNGSDASGGESTGPRADRFTVRMPTAKMLGFARSLARERNLDLPASVENDYAACRSFLDAHAPSRSPPSAGRHSRPPKGSKAAGVRPAPDGNDVG